MKGMKIYKTVFRNMDRTKDFTEKSSDVEKIHDRLKQDPI